MFKVLMVLVLCLSACSTVKAPDPSTTMAVIQPEQPTALVALEPAPKLLVESPTVKSEASLRLRAGYLYFTGALILGGVLMLIVACRKNKSKG